VKSKKLSTDEEDFHGLFLEKTPFILRKAWPLLSVSIRVICGRRFFEKTGKDLLDEKLIFIHANHGKEKRHHCPAAFCM